MTYKGREEPHDTLRLQCQIMLVYEMQKRLYGFRFKLAGCVEGDVGMVLDGHI